MRSNNGKDTKHIPTQGNQLLRALTMCNDITISSFKQSSANTTTLHQSVRVPKFYITHPQSSALNPLCKSSIAGGHMVLYYVVIVYFFPCLPVLFQAENKTYGITELLTNDISVFKWLFNENMYVCTPFQ